MLSDILKVKLSPSTSLATKSTLPDPSSSKVLVLTDIAWKPNDNEMKNIDFENYDWNKWKKQNS